MNVRIHYQSPASRERGGALGLSAPALLTLLGIGVAGAFASALFLVGGGEEGDDDGRQGEAAGEVMISPTPSASAPVARGRATAAATLADREVSGLPRGFPHSREGAVEAGTTFAATTADVQRMSGDDRLAYVRDALLEPPSQRQLDRDAEEFRRSHSLPSAAERADDSAFVSRCHPELGAYRVAEYADSRAVVDFWMPCLQGTPDASDASAGIGTRWQMGRMELRWKDGDWRVGELSRGPFDAPVEPGEPGDPVTDLATRLSLLGHDWRVYADATEEAPAEPFTGDAR
ncbi:hypothetical protein [Streptomyces sedi]|uniref:DUF8175 domain-containing protein n=1 Tax=Streptomyces sedi TaxID=555059 RepID=A0A5C4UQM7_9ACTN|nr:hypothetical protein [Streptomyces sedi]TNM25842.1 hypothetical protein FH715_25840 [Streptomyces sedi]